jgi:large subunit ribosomal protein L13
MKKENYIKREIHIIDVSGKSLGRISSQVAILLQGKNKPEFVPYKDIGDFVTIKNADKVRLSGNKISQKKYYRYTGYPGGLREEPLEELFEKSPAEVIKRSVFGMLPGNKLRPERIKRLKFE